MSEHEVLVARVIVSCTVKCPDCGADATCLGTATIIGERIAVPATVDGVVRCLACDEAGRQAALEEQRRKAKFKRGLKLADRA